MAEEEQDDWLMSTPLMQLMARAIAGDESAMEELDESVHRQFELLTEPENPAAP